MLRRKIVPAEAAMGTMWVQLRWARRWGRVRSQVEMRSERGTGVVPPKEGL